MKSFASFHKFIIIGLMFSISLLISCECIPEINTPKIISPDNYANALFVNAIADRENLTAESNDIPLLGTISYTNPDYKYIKINSGDSYLRLLDKETGLSLFNMPVRLDKFKFYTVIFYGYRNSAKALILSDSLPQGSSTYRFVHTSFDSRDFIFRVTSNSIQKDVSLSFKDFTEPEEIMSGNYTISIVDPENDRVILSSSVRIENDRSYKFVLKGTSGIVPNNPIMVELVSAPRN